MKEEVVHPPKIALCRVCKGSGQVYTDYGTFNVPKCCPQCEGSGRVTVSSETILDIRPYKPKTHKR